MVEKHPDWAEIERLLQELVAYQQQQVLKTGRRTIPHLTSDDILQPNDFPELELDPLFRYEEGMLAGVQTVQAALNHLRYK